MFALKFSGAQNSTTASHLAFITGTPVSALMHRRHSAVLRTEHEAPMVLKHHGREGGVVFPKDGPTLDKFVETRRPKIHVKRIFERNIQWQRKILWKNKQTKYGVFSCEVGRWKHISSFLSEEDLWFVKSLDNKRGTGGIMAFQLLGVSQQ